VLGKFIAIEGLEGAGKSTALHTILAVLAEHQIEAISTREPGGTVIGEELRTILKNAFYQKIMDARTELLMLYAARIQLVEEIIKPALERGCWVISDRFELSTLAYQGGGRGLDAAIIKTLSHFCLQGLQPDLTLFLNLPPEMGLQRAVQRGQLDRFEKESKAFFKRVYQTYTTEAAVRPEVVSIDASLPLEDVVLLIQKTVRQFIAAEHHG
jgi:dTMP kinase